MTVRLIFNILAVCGTGLFTGARKDDLAPAEEGKCPIHL
jgi:hypothetical protein